MLLLVEPQLTEALLRGLRDVAAAALPGAAFAPIAVVVAIMTFVGTRRAPRRARHARRPSPAPL
jgi:Ca2+/Na+ antiporter